VRDWFLAHYDLLKDFSAPILTLVWFGVTSVIVYFGFRSFDRWKREQLEERRMEVAFEALRIAYQSKHVFEHIRSPLVETYEWEKMPEHPGDDNNKRSETRCLLRNLGTHPSESGFFQSRLGYSTRLHGHLWSGN
jgi:hypothetical protein